MVKKADGSKVPADPEAAERGRLRSLAVSRGMLRRGSAPKPATPLLPSRAVARLQGRDIIRRGGQRKSRYLFAFPGLVAPIAGGRVGELANLATKNPVLYLEFPQGRIKLFGTHIYPKNKYLTLQMTRSSKGVICEDIFESLIVFSEAWWIGTKEENPEELQLEFPRTLNNGESNVDFKGGAGANEQESASRSKPGNEIDEPLSPEADNDEDIPEDVPHKVSASSAISPRQSSRISGRKFNYAETSSEEDPTGTDDEDAAVKEEQSRNANVAAASSMENRKSRAVIGEQLSSLNAKTEEPLPEINSEGNITHKESLVQTTLSSMFKKAEDKKISKSTPKRSSQAKGSVAKRLAVSPAESKVKEASKQLPLPITQNIGNKTKSKKKFLVPDDEIEEISSDTEISNATPKKSPRNKASASKRQRMSPTGTKVMSLKGKKTGNGATGRRKKIQDGSDDDSDEDWVA